MWCFGNPYIAHNGQHCEATNVKGVQRRSCSDDLDIAGLERLQLKRNLNLPSRALLGPDAAGLHPLLLCGRLHTSSRSLLPCLSHLRVHFGEMALLARSTASLTGVGASRPSIRSRNSCCVVRATSGEHPEAAEVTTAGQRPALVHACCVRVCAWIHCRMDRAAASKALHCANTYRERRCDHILICCRAEVATESKNLEVMRKFSEQYAKRYRPRYITTA